MFDITWEPADEKQQTEHKIDSESVAAAADDCFELSFVVLVVFLRVQDILNYYGLALVYVLL